MKTWISMFAIAALTALVCVLLVATKDSTDGAGGGGPQPSALPAERLAGRASAHARPTDDPWRTEAAAASEQDAEAAAAATPAKPSPPAPSTDSVRDRMSEVFSAERLDGSWDGSEMARLEKALPAMLPAGSQLTRVECRSTMCRIESTHASIDQFATFARNAFILETHVNEGPFFASVTAPPVAGQPVTTVAFIARKGHVLPMPERIAAAQ